jgi:hypothetical protein
MLPNKATKKPIENPNLQNWHVLQENVQISHFWGNEPNKILPAKAFSNKPHLS